MPFIAISLPTHENSLELQQKFYSTLYDADIRISIISHLLCLHSPSTTNEPLSSIFQWIQKCYLGILGAVLTTALVIFYIDQKFVFTIIYISCIVDFLLLLWWEQSNMHLRFPKFLIESTSGVGCVKRCKSIQSTQRLTFIFFSILSIFCISIFLLSTLIIDERKFTSTNLGSIIKLSILIISLIIGLLSMIASMTLFTTRISIISAEFHTHSEDFSRDDNTFQICVTKHYVLIHRNIVNLVGKVRTPFSAWLSIHFIIDIIILYLFAIRIWELRKDYIVINDPVFAIILICRDVFLPFFFPLARIVFIISSLERLRVASLQFLDVLVSLLCTENKIMNDQTYMVSISYSSHIRHSHSNYLSFFGLTLNRNLILKIFLVALVILFISLFTAQCG